MWERKAHLPTREYSWKRVMFSTSFQMVSPISLVAKKEGSISPFLSNDCFRVSAAETMEEQQRLLENELMDWMRDVDQVDDILVMGIRYE